MRILWFSTNSANYVSNKNLNRDYNGGGWTGALQDELIKHENVELGVCFCNANENVKVKQNGVVYYPILHHSKSFKDKVLDLLKIHDVTRDENLWPYYIHQFRNVILDFKPDIIEIFGSELYVGLATLVANDLNIPCCLHIQGILSLYLPSFLPVGVSKTSYYFSSGLRNAYSKWQYYAYWHRSVHREKRILQNAPHVLGRTLWDKSAIEILNPMATYHYGGEILRPCFYEKCERQLPEKTIIITTSSAATYKGFDLILKIANILKNEIGHEFEWKVFGNVDPVFFERLTSIKHENVNVFLCGVATAEQLRDSMLHSTVYLQPSYIENSPNSVAEAQILGLPVVATNVGGTSSMVDDGTNGVLFTATDPYMGAYALHKLIIDRTRNIKIGENAKKTALIRHNPHIIVSNLIATYNVICNAKQ